MSMLFFLAKIFSEGQLHHFLSCEDESDSGWMCFVNSAPSPWQQNLAGFQIGMQVYFYAMKDLMPGEELLVGRSLEYKRPMRTFLKQPPPPHREWQPQSISCYSDCQEYYTNTLNKCILFYLQYIVRFNGITALNWTSLTIFFTFNFIGKTVHHVMAVYLSQWFFY